MKKPIKQLETRVWRTYSGGLLLDKYLGKKDACDTVKPEDWITSFTEAKNKNYIKNEGITRVLYDGEERLITDVVTAEDFGEGRRECGVLIKYLDSGERLGIQVHPTDSFAKTLFGSNYGKTESWHILDCREGAKIYLGFKKWVTREIWRELFEKQDIDGMLNALHAITVKKGDTILVVGGTPHAIGAGCFLLEVQQPSDFTMRVEKVTVAGETLTPQQLHYGAGEENLLDCFDYAGYTEDEIKNKFFLSHQERSQKGGTVTPLITYDDTECFRLERINAQNYTLKNPSFFTVLATKTGGFICSNNEKTPLSRGDKYFIPSDCEITLENTDVLVCYPPKK